MDADEESKSLIESLYPVGKERWIKVKFRDFKKSMKAFSIRETEEEIIEKGYETRAIGVRDDYTPQISALQDIKDELVSMFLGRLYDYELTSIAEIINSKKQDLKERLIQETTHD